MATIRKRGNTYQIRVSCGYNSKGEQVIKTKTYKPLQPMTEKQLKKELDRQAVLFEEQCRSGQFMDGNITLSEFADKWFKEYAEKQLKAKTISGYNELMKRIIPALGHIRLARLQPHHLIEFYNNLAEGGIRVDTKYSPPEGFKELIKASGYTQKGIAEAAGVSEFVIRSCIDGRNISKNSAEKIGALLPEKDLFTPVHGKTTLSDKTISEHHRLLSSMLTTAVQWQIIPQNPCERVKPPKVERKEAEALDEKQAAELIQCLQEEPIKYKTAVMLLLYTGLRRGELCGLEWSDIDFTHGIISVSKSILYLPDKGIFEDSTKNKSSERFVNIPDDMMKLLKAYKAEQRQKRLLMGDLWQGSNKVFTSENGGALNPDTLTSWFSRFIKRHNLPDAHIHTLRHTSATLLIAGGVDVATVSKRLGHADKTTTLNIYTHAIKSADERAAEKLKNILNPYGKEA